LEGMCWILTLTTPALLVITLINWIIFGQTN
jgi:hypothetical protein